jgi:hypothetical protein
MRESDAVDLRGSLAGLSPARPSAALADIGPQPLDCRRLDHRADIVDHGAGDPFRIGAAEKHRDQAAKRRAEKHSVGDAELVQELEHVGGIGWVRSGVHHLRLPAPDSTAMMPLARKPVGDRLKIAGVAGQSAGRGLAVVSRAA